MTRLIFAGLFALSATVGAAQAEFAKIEDVDAFRAAVEGKVLKRPFVTLEVSPGGEISGKGLRWPVTGNWQWQDGYFCRDLYWGESELGYNCQEVRLNGGKIRFRSDRGTGDYADFSIN